MNKIKTVLLLFIMVILLGAGWNKQRWDRQPWSVQPWSTGQYDTGIVTPPPSGDSVLKEDGTNATKEDGTDWLKE